VRQLYRVAVSVRTAVTPARSPGRKHAAIQEATVAKPGSLKRRKFLLQNGPDFGAASFHSELNRKNFSFISINVALQAQSLFYEIM
jgi:hypothetical protein